MTIVPNKKYFINYSPSETQLREYSYIGWGTYTGRTMADENGDILFWFNDLFIKPGFNRQGWFSLNDISVGSMHI